MIELLLLHLNRLWRKNNNFFFTVTGFSLKAIFRLVNNKWKKVNKLNGKDLNLFYCIIIIDFHHKYSVTYHLSLYCKISKIFEIKIIMWIIFHVIRHLSREYTKYMSDGDIPNGNRKRSNKLHAKRKCSAVCRVKYGSNSSRVTCLENCTRLGNKGMCCPGLKAIT